MVLFAYSYVPLDDEMRLFYGVELAGNYVEWLVTDGDHQHWTINRISLHDSMRIIMGRR